MLKPDFIMLCTLPSYAFAKLATLYTVKNPTYTPVQFDDFIGYETMKTGKSYCEVLQNIQERQKIESEFLSFLSIGLELRQNIILTGPTWSHQERQLFLKLIPSCYQVRAWFMDMASQADEKLRGNKKRWWPHEELVQIKRRFTSPELTEGFSEVSSAASLTQGQSQIGHLLKEIEV